jgi:hypothetical protein
MTRKRESSPGDRVKRASDGGREAPKAWVKFSSELPTEARLVWVVGSAGWVPPLPENSHREAVFPRGGVTIF